jgi:thioredoxin reductase (NADPH)
MSENIKDMVIIGGGPAGLTAGIYASRAKMDVVLLEKGAYGGQVISTAHVENYPGFPDGIGGFELADLLHKQAQNFGLPIEYRSADQINRQDDLLVIQTGDGPLITKTAIIATGSTPNKLGVPGEERLTGQGVSYCATCDGALYKDQIVAVVGGGDSAIEESLFLTRFAKHVHVIHWMDHLQAMPLIQERAMANDKITINWETSLAEIRGDDNVQELVMKDINTEENRSLQVDGVFIYVGITPQVEFIKGLVEIDAAGYIVTDKKMSTSVPGLYAVGDVRSESIRQVTGAVGDGATAAINAYHYLQEFNSARKH